LAAVSAKAVAALLLALLAAPAGADESPDRVDTFDGDAVGKAPAGWSLSQEGQLAATVEAGVADAPSPPNVLKINFTSRVTDVSAALVREFPAVNLDGAHGGLEYAFDVKVESIADNDSEGLQFRVWSGVSGIDVATPRILRADKKWRLYTHAAMPGAQNYYGDFEIGAWHRLRFVIEPESASAGRASWYADGKLLYIERYTGRAAVQTSNVHRFEIVSIPGRQDNKTVVYIDNLRIGRPEAESRER
jgi:hypothetical protein